MPRYKKADIDRMSKVDPATLENFKELSPKVQQQIIRITMEPAVNPKAPKQEAQIARARAKMFAQVAKKLRKKKKK